MTRRKFITTTGATALVAGAAGSAHAGTKVQAKPKSTKRKVSTDRAPKPAGRARTVGALGGGGRVRLRSHHDHRDADRCRLARRQLRDRGASWLIYSTFGFRPGLCH